MHRGHVWGVGNLQTVCCAQTFDVHITSLRWMFIHVSQLTRWPL